MSLRQVERLVSPRHTSSLHFAGRVRDVCASPAALSALSWRNEGILLLCSGKSRGGSTFFDWWFRSGF